MACIDGSSLIKITAYLRAAYHKETRNSLNKEQPTPRLFDVIVPSKGPVMNSM